MNIYITVGSYGTRLKGISPKDKHLLYFKNKRIIDWIKDILPSAKIIGEEKRALFNFLTQHNYIIEHSIPEDSYADKATLKDQ